MISRAGSGAGKPRHILAGLILVMTVVAAAAAVSAARGGTRPGAGEPVWRDEFEGPAGQLPDTGKWVFDQGTDWGNLQLEWDTDLPANVSLDGRGHLAITARRQQHGGQPYTSGRIKTKGRFERTYGRFEARIKLPRGQGIWPAFWMLGADIDTVPWPDCGEIDIMEYRGHEPDILWATIHGTGHWGDDAVTTRFQVPGGDLDRDFHVYAIDWSPDRIVWTLDGTPYKTATPGDLPQAGRWIYDHPFFILLNVAVGGRWVGAPDSTTVFPQTMLVDYVRVYDLSR